MKFWVVVLWISFLEVFGFNMLLLGSYIVMLVNDKGKEKLYFIVFECLFVILFGIFGLYVMLKSDDEFVYKFGDFIIYKGFKVGEFEDVIFNIEECVVYYDVFIEVFYYKFIINMMCFWDVSGVKLLFEFNGVSVEIGSLEILLVNGIIFGIFEGVLKGE